MSKLIDRLKLIEELRNKGKSLEGPPSSPLPTAKLSTEAMQTAVKQTNGQSESTALASWTEVAPLVWRRRFPAPNLPSLSKLASLSLHSGLLQMPEISEHALWYDTETLGLSTGAGTPIFLWGGLRFIDGEAQITQLFLADFPGEPDFLQLIQQELSSAASLVSFNGKSFDRSLLRSRFILSGMRYPELPELDLVHIARRIWRDSLPSCSLGSLEEHVLLIRREQDLPGQEIPARYQSYLQHGSHPADACELIEVFEHHRADLESMLLLQARICQLLELLQGDAAPTAAYSKLRAQGLGLGALVRILDSSSRLSEKSSPILEALCSSTGPYAEDLAASQSLSFRAAAAFTRLGKPVEGAKLLRRLAEKSTSPEVLKRLCLCLEFACADPRQALTQLEEWGPRVLGPFSELDLQHIWSKRLRRLRAKKAVLEAKSQKFA